MSKEHVPKFLVRMDSKDVSTQLRIQQITNGFVVRTGAEPIFYKDIESAAEAIRLGLLDIRWPNANDKNGKSSK